VIFNGRAASNTTTDAILNLLGRRTDRTAPEPVDQLPCPYLLLAIDCDAEDETELREYLCETWRTTAPDLAPIFSNCFRYNEEATGPDSFADYVLRCRVETTMPFNDYWVTSPPLPSLSLATVAIVSVVTTGTVGVALLAVLHRMLGTELAHSTLSLVAIVISLAMPSVAAGLYAAYRLVLARGGRPFPAAPDSDLPSVLKALYLQRALIWFATVLQGASPDHLYNAFAAFLKTVRVSDPDSPSQAPGTIPSREGEP
jgi:hypothetical protein